MHPHLEQIQSLRQAIGACLDLVFPRDCLLTSEPIEPDNRFRYLGPKAARSIRWIHEPRCLQCGAPLWGCTANTPTCSHCATLDPAFEGNRSAVLLNGATRRLIHQLKYHQGHYVLHDIRRIICEAPGYLEEANDHILIPVPLHPRKLRERGFNQSAVIAQLISGLATGARTGNGLVRRIDTESQTRLSREARIRNTRHAFATAPGFAVDPNASYILVDDVFTTGATLNACAAALWRAGARHLSCLTFGHG
ncbi:MAG: ComF family protein [Opitutales bacterium]|nr:ComF family protein [Opitutales bacterium]